MTLDDTVRPLPVTRGEPLDPPAALDALRESEPVSRLRYPDGHVGWLVTGHQQARAVTLAPQPAGAFERDAAGGEAGRLEPALRG